MHITRRKLFQGAVTLGAGLALGPIAGLAGHVAHAGAPGESGQGESERGVPLGETPAVLYDITQCVGCHLCEVACQVNKGLPADIQLLTLRRANPAEAPAAVWAVRRQQCMHCVDPNCAAACPVAAMYKTPEGPVIYRDERCLGCRYCMNACPFGVPTFDWDRGLMDGALIRKCDFCYSRQQEGKQPACIDACPTKAVIFGRRDELLAEAKARIAAHPDKYVDHVYGEHEAGGTSFLLISGVPFDQLGFPDPGQKVLSTVSKTVMGATIPFALTWAAVLTGITGLTRLRDRGGAPEQHAEKEDAE